jgi:hypothetical protein
VDERAEADYDVAIAKADGERKVADEACEAMSGDAQANCKLQAEQMYDSAKVQAQSQRDTARGTGTMTTGATGGATDTNDLAPKNGG